MISNWIFVIVMILLAILAYFIGLTRGITGSQHLYDDGYEAGITYCMQHYEMTEIEPMLDDLYEEQQREKQQKARRLVRELDDLFDPECPLPEDDDNILDGGTY